VVLSRWRRDLLDRPHPWYTYMYDTFTIYDTWWINHTNQQTHLLLLAPLLLLSAHQLRCAKQLLFIAPSVFTSICVSMCLCVCACLSPFTQKLNNYRTLHKLMQCVRIYVKVNPISDQISVAWPLNLRDVLLFWRDTLCVRDIDSPRSKCCEGESISLTQGVSGRCACVCDLGCLFEVI